MPEWFVSITGEALAPILWVAFVAVLVCGLAVLLIALARKATGLRALSAVRGRAPRLSVVDMARVGDRRQLVLVRRDEVEHLILIGGQNDLLVEPQIVRIPAVARARAERVGLDFNEDEAAPTDPQAQEPNERRLPDVANILRRKRAPETREREAAQHVEPSVPDQDESRPMPEPAPVAPITDPEDAAAAQALRDRMNRSQEEAAPPVAEATQNVEPIPAGDEGPQEKRPTSVKSFVTMIQDRQKEASKSVSRQMPASLATDKRDDAPQSVRSSAPARSQASHPVAPASLESAVTANDPPSVVVETVHPQSDEAEDAVGPAPANDDHAREFSAPEVEAEASPSGKAEAPAVRVSPTPSPVSQSDAPKRRLTLEEEMRKLLGEFSAGSDDRIGRN